MLTYDNDAIGDAARALGLAEWDKAVMSLATHPERWQDLSRGAYAYVSLRTDEVYTVTLDTCTCPAYVKPVAAGDPPKDCYHRRAVTVLELLRRAASLARIATAYDSAALPDTLTPVADPAPIPAGSAPPVPDVTAWIAFQQNQGMIITETSGRASLNRRRR